MEFKDQVDSEQTSKISKQSITADNNNQETQDYFSRFDQPQKPSNLDNAQKQESQKDIPILVTDASTDNQKKKIVFTEKKEEVFLSPFDQLSTPKAERALASPKTTKKKEPFKIDINQKQRFEKFQYLIIGQSLLQKLKKVFLEQKQKQLRFGSNQTSQLDLNLEWKDLQIATTVNLTVLREHLTTKEWIENTKPSELRIWASKITKNKLQDCLRKELGKQSPQIDKNSFILLDQLSSWYTVAHLQSKFNQLFFVIELKQNQSFIMDVLTPKCPHCSNAQTTVCLCLTPNYCQKCLSSDQSRLHRIYCRYSMRFQLTCEEMILSNFPRLGLIGLKNPNNICFLNTALQCLLAVQPLTKYFLFRAYFKDLNPGNYLGSFGQITSRYAQFIRHAWCESSPIYDPKPLKNSLGRFYNDFVNSEEEQDSHECFSFILNCLREDLNKAPSFKFIEEVGNAQDNQDQEKTYQRTWKNLLKKNNSIIDELFTILVKSKIDCSQCGYKSIGFEQTIYLPLPVLPPQKKIVERKATKLLFIHKDCSARNILISFNLEIESLDEIQNKTRAILALKSHRKLAFYILSINGDILKLTKKINLAKALPSYNDKIRELCCVQYTQEELSPKCFEATLVFQTQNRKLGTYQNVGYKRPIFFNRLQRPATGRQIFKKILVYLYPRIFINDSKISQQTYIYRFLNKPPFRLFLITQSTNGMPIQIQIQDQIKVSIQNTEIIARFESQHEFNLHELTMTKKHESFNLDFEGSNYKRKSVVTQDATLIDCINSLGQVQLLSGYQCPKCKEKCRAFRKSSIYQTSKIIIFFFKRFDNHSLITRQGQTHHQKLQDYIQFPLLLDLSPYIQSRQTPFQPEFKGEYKLIAVANHLQQEIEGIQCGHYIAFVQNRHKWFVCNDQAILQIDSTNICTKDAYYLIYERV